jgi:phytoene desaturase
LKKKIVIIGAGFGGLSAAAYLARDGHEVLVLEKNSQPGGRAMVAKEKGFTFDLGPSWYMMPDVFDDFFADFGKKTSDFYELKKLTPSYRVYNTTTHHDIKSTDEGGLALFDQIEPGSAEKIKKLLKKTEKEYNTVRRHLLEKDYTKATDLLNPKAVRLVSNPALIGSYHNRIKQAVKDPELQKILEFMVVFMGGSPENIPAVYSLLSHVDLNLGIWYPMGGFGAVVKAFEKLAKKQGAKFRYNAEVTKIVTKGKRTLGVFVGEDYIPADIVIANADYHHTETKLLDDRHRTYHERYWRRKTMSPSSLLIYLGVKKQVPGLLHHTMFFDADWHGHFNQVFKEKGWVSRPLFYVGTPSKSDSKVAPKNKENIVILVPIASGVKVDDAHRKELVESVIARMEARLGVPFAKDITVKQVRDIEYFEDTFNAYKGNAFGLAHTLTQTAMLRPRMQSSKVKNLFFVGQYTNPGTGVPIVVLSGKVVANLVNNTIEHEDRRSNHL